MIINESDYLEHYGTLHKSGRYPWMSGEEGGGSSGFLAEVHLLRKKGLSEKDIATGLGYDSTTQYRARLSMERNAKKNAEISDVARYAAKGMGNSEIARKMGKNESSIRALRAPTAKAKADILMATSNMLKDVVGEKKYIDVSAGVEHHLGISETKLKTAVAMLREQGYELHYLKVPQLGTNHETSMKVLCAPGTPYTELMKNRDLVTQAFRYSDDGGKSYSGALPPLQIHPDRVGVTYKDKGGDEADGVIYVRPGVKDIELGQNNYAQVRIAVGDGHYLKGMAIYKQGLPKGTDLMFNTNKSDTGNKLDAFKKVKDDPTNPFGSTTRQLWVRDENGERHLTSAMNMVNEEGKWDQWSRNLPDQFLSKQDPRLAKNQLRTTFEDRQAEFERLSKLTNPTVKRELLKAFSESTDSAAVHMKAAALPRQATKVILPISDLNPMHVYAPSFNNGERVALVRFPHGGTFEIPELIVNNNHPGAKKLLGDARDAIGIHHSVATKLSGADFDGDTVLVIPNDSNKVRSSATLAGLKGFDHQALYPKYEGMKVMTARNKGSEMGNISNLITDMTLKGASTDELSRAIRHSMVVIDAEKHELDYKKSAVDHGIASLKEKYQGRKDGGASTLLSRARSDIWMDEIELQKASKGGSIDRKTGALIYVPTGKSRTDVKGNVIPKQRKYEKLSVTTDARTLISDKNTTMERIYAEHSNNLKALANKARLEMINTPKGKYSPSAKQAYAKEVKELRSELVLAQRNAPLERQAQILGNAKLKILRAAHPDMDSDQLKKAKFTALEEARVRMQTRRHEIDITDKQWEAIQAGAIADNFLSEIIQHAKPDRVLSLAAPRQEIKMTSSKTARAEDMLRLGYTRGQVAKQLGVSLSTLDAATIGGES